MKPFVFDPTLEPVEQERQVIGWFRDNPPKNAKVLLTRIRQIYHLVPPFIQKSFCNVIASKHTKDKMLTLRQFFYEMDNVPRLIEDIKRAGGHGMIIYKEQFYPISLDTNTKWLSKNDLHEWTLEQESEIINQAVDAWMIEQCVKTFNEKVVLFSQFGFSGVSHLLDITMDEESWVEAKRLKMTRELQAYLSEEHVPEK